MTREYPPNYVYLLGPDGVGKTYHTNKLSDRFAQSNLKYYRTWLGFRHIFSIPLLILARVLGYTTNKTDDSGNTISQHHFHRSLILSRLYPPLLFIDTLIIIVYEFLKFRISDKDGIIFDRFVYDTISQAMVSTGRDDIHKSVFAKLLLKFVPAGMSEILLMADESTLRNRRADVARDPNLRRKLETYMIIAEHFDLPIIYTTTSKEQVADKIWEKLCQ